MLLLVCMFYVHESTLTCAGIWYYWEKNWKKGAHQAVNSLFMCFLPVEALHLGTLMAAHGYFFPISDHVLTLKDDGTFYRFQVRMLMFNSSLY